MKCDICRENIQTQYLDKQVGTVIKTPKGKKLWICSRCQSKFHNKKEVLLRQIG